MSKKIILHDILKHLEHRAPLAYQESYDNSGLLIGSKDMLIKAAMLCLDCTEAVIDEAIQKKCNLILSHHPLIFSGIKKINGTNEVERTIIKAIKHDIAIVAMHTNLDNVINGVNAKIASKLNLKQTQILQATASTHKKLITFVPSTHIEQVKKALFQAGAGHIGNYSECGFESQGLGSYKPLEGSSPFKGSKNKIHHEEEIKFETIYPTYLELSILKALQSSHPYEEVAYDLISLSNQQPTLGAGMIGYLQKPMDVKTFLAFVKKSLKTNTIKYTKSAIKQIEKIAICGGSGSFLIQQALKQDADAFISADFKYHQFFESEQKLMILDIGHYESEQFTQEIFYELLSEKFPNFAIHFTQVNTNPINYYS
ncbi:MAG: Nif3-like dinuclear metal center hexameric protein [Chitinophagaceae bacterium]